MRGVLPKDPVFFSGTRAFRRGIYCSAFCRWVTRLHLPQKTLRKKFALAAASIVAALLVAEIAARGWAFAQGQPYSAERARESIREIVTQMTAELPGVEGEAETPARKEALFTLHPYSGYDSGLGLKITERAVAHFHDPDATAFTIFVHGGSVAAIFAGIQRGALDVVTQQLAEHPSVARPVRVFRMATAGFKQPQQLAQLAYLLSRGCRPNVVINLDGLNEVRTGTRHAVLGMQPTWPSIGHWTQAHLGGRPDAQAVDHLVDMEMLQREAQSLSDHVLGWELHHSSILGRLYLSRLGTIRFRWSLVQEAYIEHALTTDQGKKNQPFGVPPETEDALGDVIENWFESSVSMQHLCEPRGILYLHVIQPTLHDPGSKLITPAEREKGIGAKGMDPDVVKGYEMMRARVEDLKGAGVTVLDATRIFADNAETLYYDNCHVGRKGNEILAEHIYTALAETLE